MISKIIFEKLNKDQFKLDYKKLSLSDMATRYGVSGVTISNWRRRIGMPQKRCQWKNLIDYELSEKQIQIIIGSMLGDGCLTKVESSNRNSRFHEIHSSSQASWLKWKQDNLRPINSAYTQKETQALKRLDNGKIVKDLDRGDKYKQCVLRTIVHPIFTELESIWYKRDKNGDYIYKPHGKLKKRIKTLPENLQLSPLSMAVWFVDDGSNGQKRKSCKFSTGGFEYEEVNRLCELLYNFGFMSYIQKGGNYPEIVIPKKSYIDFIEMIRSEAKSVCFPDCIKYKFDTSKYKLFLNRQLNYGGFQFSNKLLKKIENDIRTQISQIEISYKYNIPYSVIRLLIGGKIIHKGRFISGSGVYYRNTSGTKNIYFNKSRNRYVVNIGLNGKTIHLGRYKEKKEAIKVVKLAKKMRSDGEVNIKKYKDMALSYNTSFMLRSNNTSGIVGVCYCNKAWTAYITVNKKQVYLGSYKNKKDAIKIRKLAEDLILSGNTCIEDYKKLRKKWQYS